ncbi:MAG: hypothetical protein R3A78_01000 [Polyangiales bacterium]|nr:hypothetical protein [Myxococcales bacterium]
MNTARSRGPEYPGPRFRAALLALAIFGAPTLAIGGCDHAGDGDARATSAKTGAAVPGNAAGSTKPAAARTAGETADHDDTATASPFPSLFFGKDDSAERRALATAPIARIEKGKGGRTLAFKITLEDGTVGYYKPEQSFSGSHWYAELASYYLDRELGIGRVPPAVGRVLPWKPLLDAAGDDERVSEITVQPDGTVRGAFIWWIPEDLERLPMGQGWETWVRVEGPLRISPYQRPHEWKDDRNAGRATHPWPTPAGEPDTAGRPAELADMILFDYLTTNVDRWGGENTNVRTRGAGGPLLYFDNGAGFTPGEARIPLTDARLEGLQRFRKVTVDRMAALDPDHLRARMATDPLAPVLSEKQFEHLSIRRARLVEYTAALLKRFGDRALFPE